MKGDLTVAQQYASELDDDIEACALLEVWRHEHFVEARAGKRRDLFECFLSAAHVGKLFHDGFVPASATFDARTFNTLVQKTTRVRNDETGGIKDILFHGHVYDRSNISQLGLHVQDLLLLPQHAASPDDLVREAGDVLLLLLLKRPLEKGFMAYEANLQALLASTDNAPPDDAAAVAHRSLLARLRVCDPSRWSIAIDPGLVKIYSFFFLCTVM